MSEEEIWYRADRGGFSDETLCIKIQECRVWKKTSKGVWLNGTASPYGHFVLFDARKRWAYPTKELAMESFIRRKEKEIQHCERQLTRAKRLLRMARGEEPVCANKPNLFSFT